MPSRSPHGERGLKSVDTSKVVRLQTRRSPHGERGLKTLCGLCTKWENRRSPHGERGLKSVPQRLGNVLAQSLPSRGAWIEKINFSKRGDINGVAPLTGSVD